MKKNYRRRNELFREIVLKCKKEKVCNKCLTPMDGIIKKLDKVAGKIIYSLGTKYKKNI